MVEKRSFTLPSYVTVGGQPIKDIKIGWESYGSLNADKSNAILITHYFSATSYAAGRYKADDKAAGYWDAIIGPGKPLDTDKYFILSSDTLVNLNAKDPNVVTTGPATIDPSTGKPYGRLFPIVTTATSSMCRKALVESLGMEQTSRRHGRFDGSAAGLRVGFQAIPGMVSVLSRRSAPAKRTACPSPCSICGLRRSCLTRTGATATTTARQSRLPGLSTALAMVTLHAQHWAWTNSSAFGRKWAVEGKDPASCLLECKYAIEAVLDNGGKARAATSDANHFLYLVKANQIFVAGGGNLADGLKKIDAPVLLITSDDDLIFTPDVVNQTAQMIKSDGTPVEQVKIKGGHGHLDGVLAIGQAGQRIAEFLGRK